jgi:5-methylcytosine-specific restriction protein A
MPKAWKVCATPQCPELVPADQSRCDDCTIEADKRRGTASERGYTSAGHKRFRKRVLQRDPICVVCRLKPSTVADHHPLSRRDLVAQGLDPDDPDRGRGVCKRCHDSETAAHQPGGWNQR